MLLYSATSYSFSSDRYLLDTSYMPEETRPSSFPGMVYYFPDDSDYCHQTPLFVTVKFDEYGERYDHAYYKVGVGKVYAEYWGADTDEEDQMMSTTLSGSRCVVYSGVQNIPTIAGLEIYPNPATSELNIKAADNISTVTITNMLGQTISDNRYNAPQVQVNITSLPTGVYFVRLNGTEVRKFVKK